MRKQPFLFEIWYNTSNRVYRNKEDTMKKLLSILLTITMVVTLLTGCGDKSSSYFDDAESILKDDQGAYELSMDMNTDDLSYFGENAESVKALCETNIVSTADEDGNLYIGIKPSDDDQNKTSLDIVIYNGFLYLDMDAVMEYVKETNPESVKDTEAGFKQMGLEGKVKVDMKKLAQILGFKWNKKSIKESKEKFDQLISDTFSALKEEYSGLQCEVDKKSAIKIDSNSIGEAIEDTINFVDKDAGNLVKGLSSVLSGIFGKDMAKNIINSDDTDKNIKDMKDSLKKNKDDIVKSFKDKKQSIVSKADTEDDELTIEINDKKDNASAEMKIKKLDGEIDIRSKASKDSQDVTDIIVSLFGMFQSGAVSQNQ